MIRCRSETSARVAFVDLAVHLAPLFLQHSRELRVHVLLQEPTTFSVCRLAALDCWMLVAHDNHSHCSEVGYVAENGNLSLFFFRLFSDGLLTWECARNRDRFSGSGVI